MSEGQLCDFMENLNLIDYSLLAVAASLSNRAGEKSRLRLTENSA